MGARGAGRHSRVPYPWGGELHVVLRWHLSAVMLEGARDELKPCFFLEWVGRRAAWLGAGGEVLG